jgi:hypothetical protein
MCFQLCTATGGRMAGVVRTGGRRAAHVAPRQLGPGSRLSKLGQASRQLGTQLTCTRCLGHSLSGGRNLNKDWTTLLRARLQGHSCNSKMTFCSCGCQSDRNVRALHHLRVGRSPSVAQKHCSPTGQHCQSGHARCIDKSSMRPRNTGTSCLQGSYAHGHAQSRASWTLGLRAHYSGPEVAEMRCQVQLCSC